MRVALTGHRPERLRGQEVQVSKFISQQLKELYEPTKENVAYCSMALGADSIFAMDTMINKNYDLICCYPFHKKMSDFEEFFNKKYKTVFVSETKYNSNKQYFLRDKYMVDNCDVLLAVWDGVEQGGIWLTIKYARKCGKKIIYHMIDRGE